MLEPQAGCKLNNTLNEAGNVTAAQLQTGRRWCPVDQSSSWIQTRKAKVPSMAGHDTLLASMTAVAHLQAPPGSQARLQADGLVWGLDEPAETASHQKVKAPKTVMTRGIDYAGPTA